MTTVARRAALVLAEAEEVRARRRLHPPGDAQARYTFEADRDSAALKSPAARTASADTCAFGSQVPVLSSALS